MSSPLSCLRTLFLSIAFLSPLLFAQYDQIQVAPPMRQIQPPSPDASAAELEKQGDELRAQKAYVDAIDYFRASLAKDPNNASVLNKMGIAQLMLQRYKDAGKSFENATKNNRQCADAYNNRCVVEYERRKYGAAIKQYKKALKASPDSASFYSNLGAAYFAKKKFEQASEAYMQAVKLDPTIFEHSSRTGVAVQMASPKDRARYDYVIAKLYAKFGDSDRSLQYLRKAMEDGYKDLDKVYTDPEFAQLRKDARFTELMKEHPQPIAE